MIHSREGPSHAKNLLELTHEARPAANIAKRGVCCTALRGGNRSIMSMHFDLWISISFKLILSSKHHVILVDSDTNIINILLNHPNFMD